MQSEDPGGEMDDTSAINSIRFLICKATSCSQNCETCSGPEPTDCLTCKAGFSLQPDYSCALGCPATHF